MIDVHALRGRALCHASKPMYRSSIPAPSSRRHQSLARVQAILRLLHRKCVHKRTPPPTSHSPLPPTPAPIPIHTNPGGCRNSHGVPVVWNVSSCVGGRPWAGEPGYFAHASCPLCFLLSRIAHTMPDTTASWCRKMVKPLENENLMWRVGLGFVAPL